MGERLPGNLPNPRRFETPTDIQGVENMFPQYGDNSRE
jgi:hypothetical protein